MPIQAGLYKALFGTPRGTGAGVVYVKDGRLHGGDGALYYVGNYLEGADGVRAEVITKRHTAGAPSVFGIDQVSINLSGHASGNNILLKGNSPQSPGVSFEVHLTWLSD